MELRRKTLKEMLKEAVREPLVHFLIIGGLLYLYFDVTHRNPTAPKKKEILLLEYDLKQLRQQNGVDDKSLLMEYLKYKRSMLADAYALELNKDDALIEHELLKKREFILNANAKVKEPDQKKLKNYYAKHSRDFSRLLRFDLIVKKFDKTAKSDMIKKLVLFGDLKKAQDLEKYKNVDLDMIAKKYGKYVALKIASIPEGYWSEPLRLQDGIYLFYVSNKQTEAKPQPFEDIESEAYRQYMYTKRLQNLQKAYRDLLKNYTFKVAR